jgi:hypothetical protein
MRRPIQNGSQFYSWGVKQRLISGDGMCLIGCALLTGQPTMVKPVELEFRFMVPVVAACSMLGRACRGAAGTGGAWRSLPGAA